MEVFRIVKSNYANQLTSSGKAGRWNHQYQHTIYTDASRSLATLELLVNRAGIPHGANYQVMVIEIPNEFDQIDLKDLPENWRSLASYPNLQYLGSQWYLKRNSLVLRVPSAVIPKEYNYVLNTSHPDFESFVKLIGTEKYFWDERL
jgi:RES domain-containing protein